MYLSLEWLKDFVDIPKKIKPEELGLRLTTHTVEIDSVQKESDKYKNIIVAKILEIKKHPNADKLQLVTLDTKREKIEVVCGAFNIKAGQKVPLALVGAVLPACTGRPGGMEIKEVEVRGVKSSGMLCAEDELGFGDDHSGIYILDDSAKVGDNIADHLKLNDIVFEVDNKSITHRPDLWGHYGLAREIAAFLKLTLKPYPATDIRKLAEAQTAKIDVKIQDFKLCPRYMGITIEGITIEPSPRWMQRRLIAAGMRPINNIVDITNYVMLELGQPLHAFDAGKVKNILVRRASKGEQFVTLDGQTRELDEEMLMITDGERPVAIAGVMGGANSEIDGSTRRLIIESANFNFVSIRKTAQKLGLRTEASVRFEKSLDPHMCEVALARTCQLIKEVCPNARIVSQIADEKDANIDLSPTPIEIDMSWLHRFVGDNIREKKAVDILQSLGFIVTKVDKKFIIQIPTWRASKDISIKEDLAEEIVRIYGYDELELSMPSIEMKIPETNKENMAERKIKNLLVGAPGLTEVDSYSFVGEDQLKKLGLDHKNHIHIANPIASHQTMLRQSLAPNLLNAVRVNQARYSEFGLFEIGSVFMNIEGDLLKGDESGEKLPYQEKRIGMVLAGKNTEELFSRIKGMIKHLTDNFDLPLEFSPVETVPAWADAKISAKIMVYDKIIGFIYKLNEETANRTGIKKAVLTGEINLKEFYKFIIDKPVTKFQEFEKFPPAVRDIAFVVSEKILYNDIRKEILSFHPFVKKVELFDIFQGDKLGKGNKNLAFSITYQADKTLTAAEVDEIQAGLIKRIEEKFEAKVRNF